ncbi:PHP domain-containing protein [Mariniphaga sediminis]|jgi:PHP family Zn ribbon phosphoesterase|uniref:PHP domain-containing protein n=2 Tax=Mariniphaga sediminis TaxID=1628158 RepID=A0A399CYK3_9BACT|nr:PHP domain-containing protein [Mariniphaga sediminis]RIH64407.1 PHP domain-containing protein [Mariniphaga sediminis]
MKKYRADLHIHTLLSPCADLEMTPNNIVKKARASGLHIIGITDHNATKHALLVKKIAEETGIFTLTGAEVTTKEEVHCLAFFAEQEQLHQFQDFIDENITRIPNTENYFGYQPVIDEQENILELVPYYLPAALKTDIHSLQQTVEKLNGIFIPAHIDRPVNGIISQLGFIPPGLKYDALGLSRHGSEKHVKKQYVLQNKTTLIRNSDAHFLEQIGDIYTVFNMEEISFSEIKKALNQQDKRFCEIV